MTKAEALEEYQKAGEEYDKARSLGPSSGEAYYKAGETYSLAWVKYQREVKSE